MSVCSPSCFGDAKQRRRFFPPSHICDYFSREVMGRYSNLCDQGERLRALLEMVPEGPSTAIPRTIKQIQRRLRGAEIDQLVASYRAGATVYELSAQFGMHRHTVSEVLERRGVSRRYQRLSLEQVDLACTLYESGHSLIKVGEQLGRKAETVRQALMKAGVEIKPRNGWHSERGADGNHHHRDNPVNLYMRPEQL